MKFPQLRWHSPALVLVILAALGVLVWGISAHLGSHDFFMPHAHCYLMRRDLILLHGISDLLIGAAYVAISATLVFLVLRARREIPFHWMMLAFATFIIACGATHFMEVWTLQTPHPAYWLSGDVKLVTAIASVATAFLLPPLVPAILRLLQEARLSGEHRQQLEVAHQQLEKTHERVTQLDQLKTDFFANVSHELRTPLTLILGPIERLLAEEAPAGRDRAALEVVHRNALLLRKHVNDLLDVSKLEAGRMQMNYSQVDGAHLVRMVVDYFASSGAQPRELLVEVPGALPFEADSDKLQRVLFNLLSNACKFTPPDGLVRVTMRSAEEGILLLVEDNGPGVPAASRTAIFERFTQGDGNATRRGGAGTGLGLSIVKEFVELHGGRVSVEDAPSGGALFRVWLPRHAPEGAEVAPAPDVTAPKAGSTTVNRETAAALLRPHFTREAAPAPRDGRPFVIVAEDNPDMREHIVATLGDEYFVRTASNGRLALQLAEEEAPDLIVSDLMMPEMTGEELIFRLLDHPRLKSVPVILLTARADDDLKLNLLSAGAQDYVLKPFTTEELRVRVRNQISAKHARDALQSELASQEHDLARLAREVTARARDLERARAAAEAANRTKDHFLAVLSHELRTPLTPVLALATNLDEQLPDDPEELRAALRIIRRNVELEARLIDDLLDLTRVARGKLRLQMGSVDAHEMIRASIEMCRSELLKKGERLELDLQATRHHLQGDAARLLQIFWNLLLNAIKFTPPDGLIRVRSCNRAETQLVLEVNDTGIGIPAEALAKIFEPFEQVERAHAHSTVGLGLGLAVAKGLVDAHGGTISAASAGRDQGATFTVTFPTTDAPPALPERPVLDAPAAPLASASLRILLVEDHDDTRHAMARLLTRAGHQLTVAGSVAEALAAAQSASFEVLLSDVGLPDGTGTDLLLALRKLQPEVIAIAMSGFGMEEDLRRSREAGFTEHLVKPVDAANLKGTLARLAAARS